MKYTTQFECMDKECNTIVLGTHKQDGIICPRCNGPVLPKPFEPKIKISERALFVRNKIIERCKKHCFDLTPEQVETVLELYDEYQKGNRVINVKENEIVIPLTLDGKQISNVINAVRRMEYFR